MLLTAFVDKFEEKFGRVNMVYIIHLPRHLVKIVRQNGPLHAYSAYCMESNIGYIVSTINGTSDVLKQCSERYILLKEIHNHISNDGVIKDFYNAIRPPVISDKLSKNPYLTPQHLGIIESELGNDCILHEYDRLMINGDLYCPESKDRQIKSNDSFVVINDHVFGMVVSIFESKNNGTMVLLRNDFLTDDWSISGSVKFLRRYSKPQYTLISINNISRKPILIQFMGCDAYILMPNSYEVD